MGRYAISSALAAVLLGADPSAGAQEIPAAEDLSARASEALPAFWSIDAFRVIASAKEGDPVSPRSLIRFEADATPRRDLFASTGEKIGPFEVVVETQSAEAARTLYGTMDLAYRAGSWEGDTAIENPVDGLGQPLESFATPVLELGSPKFKEVSEALRAEVIGATRARLESEIHALEAEHRRRVEELKAGHAAALAALEIDHEQELAAMHDRHGEVVVSAEARLAEETARFADELDAKKAELMQGHESEMAALRTSHAKQLGDLKARQAQELAEAETGLAAMKESLARQLETADRIAADQEAVIAKLKAIADQGSSIEQLRAAALEKRKVAVESLIGYWSAVVDCGPDQFTVNLKAEKLTGLGVQGGVTGNLTDTKRDGHVGELAIVADGTSLPLDLRLTVHNNTGAHGWKKASFDVVLDGTGVATGKGFAELRRENFRAVACEKVVLSQRP